MQKPARTWPGSAAPADWDSVPVNTGPEEKNARPLTTRWVGAFLVIFGDFLDKYKYFFLGILKLPIQRNVKKTQ
jgi:hypothetical protein